MTKTVSFTLPKPGGHTFVVRVPKRVLTFEELKALGRSLGVWAVDPELPEFNWSDVGFLMREIARSTRAAAKEV